MDVARAGFSMQASCIFQGFCPLALVLTTTASLKEAADSDETLPPAGPQPPRSVEASIGAALTWSRER